MVVASVGADLGHLPSGGPRDRLEVDALAEDVQHARLDLDGDLLPADRRPTEQTWRVTTMTPLACTSRPTSPGPPGRSHRLAPASMGSLATSGGWAGRGVSAGPVNRWAAVAMARAWWGRRVLSSLTHRSMTCWVWARESNRSPSSSSVRRVLWKHGATHGSATRGNLHRHRPNCRSQDGLGWSSMRRCSPTPRGTTSAGRPQPPPQQSLGTAELGRCRQVVAGRHPSCCGTTAGWWACRRPGSIAASR
jgi:hypothetical protein